MDVIVKEGLKNVHDFGQSLFSVNTKFLKLFREILGHLELKDINTTSDKNYPITVEAAESNH